MKEFYIDSDGIRLHAKLERPRGRDNGSLCILIHGFTGHMEEKHILAARDAMLDSNVAVLRAEMYGHGKSGGDFREHNLYKWVNNGLSVIRYAKEISRGEDLYLCGHSQGGLLTMLLGGMCSADIKAILPLSPAWMIPEIARQGEILGTRFDPSDIPDVIRSGSWEISGDYVRVAQTIHVEDEIERYGKRVFLVHGDMDETVPVSYSVKAAKMYNNAELVTIDGADHCFNGKTTELYNAIRKFFEDDICSER